MLEPPIRSERDHSLANRHQPEKEIQMSRGYFPRFGYSSLLLTLALRVCEKTVTSEGRSRSAGAQEPECMLKYMRIPSTAGT